MKRLIAVFAVLTLLATPAFSLDTGTSTGKSKKSGKEQTQSEKMSKEKRTSKGERETESQSQGVDQQTQKAIKDIEQMMQQTGVEIELGLENLFKPTIVKWEQQDEEDERFTVFTMCRLLTSPPDPLSMRPDLQAIVKNVAKHGQSGAIYHLRSKEAYDLQVSQNLPVTDSRLWGRLGRCMFEYGSLFAAGYHRLVDILKHIADVKTVKEMDGKDSVLVAGLTRDEVMKLAEVALYDVVDWPATAETRHIILNKQYADQTILSGEEMFPKKGICYYLGSSTKAQCENMVISLAPLSFNLAGIQWFGESYAGYKGRFKVNTAWSYNDAIERLKSVSKYSRLAYDVSKYAEELVSQGKVKDAAMVKKLAWEAVKSGKADVSLASLLPRGQ